MTDELPRYRYWGDRKPNAKLATVTVATFTDHLLEALGEGSDSSPEPTPVEENPTVAVLRLYAPIDSWGGWWGISAEDVSSALDSLPPSVETVILRINSPGGEVPEAMTILNMLRAHKAKLIAVVDGWAVSAGSVIAVGCDQTVMSPGTEMMIHDARIIAYGDPAGLRKMADRMDTTSNNIASIYAAAAGGTEADWRALMGPETWYTAKEAVEAGLADRVDVVPDAGVTDTPGADDPADAEPFSDSADNVFDLSMYRYPGRNQAPHPAAAQLRPKPPTASAEGSTHTEGGSAMSFSDSAVATLRTKLGVTAEDADEATILAALDEALDERSETGSGTTIPEGHVVIPKAKLDDLTAGAADGSKAAKALHEREREEFLTANATKYAATNRGAWAKEYDRDPEGTRKHFETAPDLVPVNEIGHEIDEKPAEASSLEDIHNDATYKNWSM